MAEKHLVDYAKKFFGHTLITNLQHALIFHYDNDSSNPRIKEIKELTLNEIIFAIESLEGVDEKDLPKSLHKSTLVELLEKTHFDWTNGKEFMTYFGWFEANYKPLHYSS